MNLESVSSFEVPESIVLDTEESLRKAGRDGYELFVLWSGEVSNSQFLVRTAHVPEQESFKLPTGLSVRVDGQALHRLNAWLYEEKEILGVQVHAHPTDAFHSDTDDTFPIVTILGGLSIVVPDFCNGGLFVPDTAVYRLLNEGWLDYDASIVTVI